MKKAIVFAGFVLFSLVDLGALSAAEWLDGTEGAIYYNGGNVGIGTTAPQTRLHIVGTPSDAITGYSTRWSYTGSGNDLISGLLYSPRYPYLQGYRIVNDESSGVFLLLNPFGGKVGINTTEPQSELAVNGTITATNFVGDRLNQPPHRHQRLGTKRQQHHLFSRKCGHRHNKPFTEA